jgi:hypothetical protein
MYRLYVYFDRTDQDVIEIAGGSSARPAAIGAATHMMGPDADWSDHQFGPPARIEVVESTTTSEVILEVMPYAAQPGPL